MTWGIFVGVVFLLLVVLGCWVWWDRRRSASVLNCKATPEVRYGMLDPETKEVAWGPWGLPDDKEHECRYIQARIRLKGW